MEEMFKNQQKIRFSRSDASHQNGASEITNNMVVTLESTMLVHADLICPKDTLYTDFDQWKFTMMYGSKVGSLIYSMVYNLLDNFYPYMFWIQGCRILE